MRDARLDLMYRYVEEYTNRHDLSVAREIMHPDYRFTMGDTSLDLESYLAMVEDALRHFTDLRLVVNEFIVGPNRLAMLFTETATSPKHGTPAAWRGAALYTFHPGGRLLAVTVQQDFWGRRLQYKGLHPAQHPGTTDPAVWKTAAGAEDPAVGDAITAALADINSAEIEFDGGADLLVTPNGVEVTDMILSGRRFAAAITITGQPVRAGDDSQRLTRPGADLPLAATGAGTLTEEGAIVHGSFVTDRWGFFGRIRAADNH